MNAVKRKKTNRSGNATAPRKRFGERVISGLQELVEAMEAGGMEEVRKRFRVMDVPIPPKPITAGELAPLRRKVGLAPAAFAELLGVSPETLRAWERGEKKPTRTARKFLEAIRSDPEYWKAKHVLPAVAK